MPEVTHPLPDLGDIRAYLFDLDGVITPTASVHMHAWSRLFNPFLQARGLAPYTDQDYFTYVDGKPRYDGVRSFLASRSIVLPEGHPTDSSDLETVAGLGNRKNDMFNEALADEGVVPFPASVAFLDAVQERGLDVAVVSSSKNARAVLEAAGLGDRFELIVSGAVAADLGLPGKPNPDTFLYAASQLGYSAGECAVIEDAESGVMAAADGGFGVVIGVDRGVGAAVLYRLGATIVVNELDELIPALPPTRPTSGEREERT